MDFKELLGEELYNQVIAKAGDKHKIDVVSDGRWIPKEKFDSANEEKKQYKQQVDDTNKQLDTLKTQLKDNEGATKTIEDLKKQIADGDLNIAKVKKDSAIALALSGAKAKNVNAVKALLKLDTVQLGEDGTIIGLDEQLKTIKESDAYLFEEVDPDGTGGSRGNHQRGGGGGETGIGLKLAEQAKKAQEGQQQAQETYFK